MAAVTYIASSQGWGASFSGTVSFGKQFPAAAAHVALTSVDVHQDLNAVYLTGYTTNGNFVAASGAELGVNDADSFSWAGLNAVGHIMVYCFE
jgi:hypothetical protein